MNCVFSPCKKYRYTLWREWGSALPGLGNATPPAGIDSRSVTCVKCGSAFSLNSEHVCKTRYVQFIGLNPSTADDIVLDNTVRRGVKYALDWGYERFLMTNLFAFRATQPTRMIAQADPVGPDNDRWLLELAKGADLIVLAWGVDGQHMGRSKAVLKLLEPVADKLTCLAKTECGEPRHPLYLRASLRPMPWRA